MARPRCLRIKHEIPKFGESGVVVGKVRSNDRAGVAELHIVAKAVEE
jgi:hypothetical protein